MAKANKKNKQSVEVSNPDQDSEQSPVPNEQNDSAEMVSEKEKSSTFAEDIAKHPKFDKFN